MKNSRVKRQKLKVKVQSQKLNVKLVAWLLTLVRDNSCTYLAVDVCILLEWSWNKFLFLMRIIHMCSYENYGVDHFSNFESHIEKKKFWWGTQHYSRISNVMRTLESSKFLFSVYVKLMTKQCATSNSHAFFLHGRDIITENIFSIFLLFF